MCVGFCTLPHPPSDIAPQNGWLPVPAPIENRVTASLKHSHVPTQFSSLLQPLLPHLVQAASKRVRHLFSCSNSRRVAEVGRCSSLRLATSCLTVSKLALHTLRARRCTRWYQTKKKSNPTFPLPSFKSPLLQNEELFGIDSIDVQIRPPLGTSTVSECQWNSHQPQIL